MDREPRCGARYFPAGRWRAGEAPLTPSGPCVRPPGHRGMHVDEGFGWWSDGQAEAAAKELVGAVMEE